MTGAGSATAAYATEQSYLGGVGSSPTYRQPGSNITVDTAELSRNLLDIVAPDDPETKRFLAQQIEGQLSVSFILTSDQFHELVFNNGTATGFDSTLAPTSAEWYLGVDTLSGTTERQIQGWVAASADITYNGTTEAVRVTLTGPYGDESKNTSITPGTIQRPSGEVPGHGASLSINSTTVSKLQSATVSLQGLARLQRGAKPRPVQAVLGNVQSGLDMTAIYSGPERYELALGTSGASTTQDTVDEVTGSVTFDDATGAVASYDFAKVAPNTYSWADLVNPDADLTETVNFNATQITASNNA